MKCPICAYDSPPGMKFCGECGAKLRLVCPACGGECPPGFKFCGECGQPLAPARAEPAPPPPAAAPPPLVSAPPPAQGYTPPHLAAQILQSKTTLEGERKQVSVLFCDLVGSTALAERLGAETMHDLLNRFFELALAEVHRLEGTINQFLGDGFMALFGAPIAHEDHAWRAVLAALGLQKQIRDKSAELGSDLGAELSVRMGINTGWVVVGGIGDHLRMDYTAIGDTTNLAARLQQVARPGTILVSEAVARLVQGPVLLAELPPVLVKGKAEPIRPFEVVGLAERSESEAQAEGALSPFVGRKRELAVLDELVDLAASGEGQVVGIAGEAGAGKSRLLHELRLRRWGRDAARLSGRCLSYGSGVPYLPWLHLLRSAWQIGESEAPAQVVAKVRSGLEAVGLADDFAMSLMVRLLGGEDGQEHLGELSPQALKARTFALLRQIFLATAHERLLVVEIEDLHWADETSEELLDDLVEGLPTSRILVFLTYRSGYRPRWIEKSYATQISLRRLNAKESQAVVESVLHRSALPPDLLDAVVRKAEGNPFFLEELTRSLIEGKSAAEMSVPDTIHGVLIARIDRLPEDHKRLLQTASVLGREFRRDLLEGVWAEGSLDPLLADLKRGELVYEEPAAGQAVLFFKHALTQEAVYQSLLTGRRKALHGAAARACEILHEGRVEEAYDSLAHHYARAEEAQPAVRYLALSAERAARTYAHAEAARALKEALAFAARLPESERGRRTVELVLQLASSLLPLARLAEKLELLLAHRDLVEDLADPALAGPFHFWLAHTYSYLGKREEAARFAELAMAQATQAGDTTTLGKARYVLSRDAFWAGQFVAGIEHGRAAVALLEQSADRWWQGQAYWVAGFHHFVLGQHAEALAAMERARQIWQALEDPRLDPSWSTGYFYSALGDWERGIAECQAGLARARDPLNTGAGLGFLGYSYLEKGDLPAALKALEEAVERMEQAGMQPLYGWFAAFLTEAYSRSGRTAEALALGERALAVTREVEFDLGRAVALRALGRALLGSGETAGAAQRLREAQSLFESLSVPFEAASTQHDLERAELASPV